MIPKFRAWWIQDEVMTHIDTLEFLQGGIRVSDGCWHEKFLGDEVILMQSTGLKDKNGVEIFEGDIFAEGFGRYVVTWEAKGARWALKFVHDFEDAFHLGIRNSEEMTLIGNIYENPELLEVES